MKKWFDPAKEPYQLFVKLEDGTMKEQVHYACAHCNYIMPDRDMALNCCKQRYCQECKEPAEYTTLICSTCRDVIVAEKATVVGEKDYAGPVSDGKELFWDDMGDYLDSVSPGEELEFLYCCTVDKLKDANAERMVESLLENELSGHREDAIDEIVDVEGLVSAVKAWLEKQTLESWYPDEKRKVLVPTTVKREDDDET